MYFGFETNRAKICVQYLNQMKVTQNKRDTIWS